MLEISPESRFYKSSEIQLQLQLFILALRARGLLLLVLGPFQPLGDQLEVGLVDDDLGQVALPLDLLPDGDRHVRDHVGEHELGEVDEVLEEEEQEEEEEEMYSSQVLFNTNYSRLTF